MLRSLVLRVLRSLVLGPRSLPPRTLSTAQEGRELPLPSIPVEGRLSQFSTQWEKRTSDPWVLSIIRGGLELQFKQLPPLSESPIPFSVTSDPHKRLRLSEEVSVLLQKAAIEQVPTSSLGPGFYSHLFLVPKKKGGMRPVIDLSILNTYLVVPHFKMETNRSIRASILPGMWSTSLDLTDAYFHCPISVAFRKCLHFVWDNKVFQFRALPFGLAIAPLVFTKIFQVVSAHLHTLSIQIHSYLDDSLVKELNPDILLSRTQSVIDLLLELGFLISWKKSEIIPSQDFVFLGEHFRTDLGLVFPPEEKFLALRQFILTFLAKTSVTARSSQLSSRCSTVRTSTHSTSTVLSSRALDPVFSGLGSLYSYPGSSLYSSVLVAAEGKCHDRVSPGISSSQSDLIHRRFPSGMGSLSGGSNCFRDVVFHPSERSHQSFGNEGSSVSSFSFQTLSGVPIYCLGNRQHNSGSLPEESGRNTLLRSVSAGQGCSDPMLSIPDSSGCETYSRPSERSCGLSFQVLSTSQYRVGTSSGSLSIYSSSLGKSQYRPIRNKSELQGDNFRLPSSRPQSLCCGRNEPILGGNVRLCIPPIQISRPCSSQDNRRGMQDHSYCSSLAKTSLVCKSTASVLCQTTSASLKTKSSISVQRGCSSSFSRKTPSTRLVSVGDNLRQKGFSETATKHISRSVRESTSIVYDAKWTIFSD